MIVVKTVLKSGGEYNEKHVYRMRDMVDKYITCDKEFVCYSDIDIPGVNVRPLLNDWPIWWPKIELFKEIEESFYIDLDMTIENDITDMVLADSDFIALRNMNPRIEGIGSAMMKWRGDYTSIYNEFKACPDLYMQFHSIEKIGTPMLGDQGYIWNILNKKCNFFQELFPGRIKRFNEAGGDVKVFYGRNRPWGRGQS